LFQAPSFDLVQTRKRGAADKGHVISKGHFDSKAKQLIEVLTKRGNALT